MKEILQKSTLIRKLSRSFLAEKRKFQEEIKILLKAMIRRVE